MNLQRQNSTTPRDPRDFYPTPRGFIRSALDVLDDYLLEEPEFILDPGAGTGVWGTEVKMKWSDSYIIGVDDYFDEPAPSPYLIWWKEDFLKTLYPPQFDLLVGNPPYKYAEEFVRQSMRFLKGSGLCAFLLRLEFLGGQARAKGLWQSLPARAVYVVPRRLSFTGNGKTDAFEYAFFVWQKGYKGSTELKWLHWNYLPEDMWARNGVRGHQPDVCLPSGLEPDTAAHSQESGSQSLSDGAQWAIAKLLSAAQGEGSRVMDIIRDSNTLANPGKLIGGEYPGSR